MRNGKPYFWIFNSKFDLSEPLVFSFLDTFRDEYQGYAELMTLLSMFKDTVHMN